MHDLWAITSYFNPVRYQRRLRNYRHFRQQLGVPLVAVELSYHDAFDLQPGDAEILIQLHGRDVLWQKERLLSLALQELPAECQHVVWLDCDVVLSDSAWPEQARRALDRVPLVRPFNKTQYMTQDWSLEDLTRTKGAFDRIVIPLPMYDSGESQLRVPNTDRPVPRKPWGKAWAARRSLLDRHGFYDACILGSGDCAMLLAACGCADQASDFMCMGERRRQHYQAWAAPFHSDVQGQVGYLDGNLYHLWHGDLSNRRYWERHDRLSSFHFDPYEDIALDECGIWRWNSDKPEMHQYVRDYFALRKEDEGIQ